MGFGGVWVNVSGLGAGGGTAKSNSSGSHSCRGRIVRGRGGLKMCLLEKGMGIGWVLWVRNRFGGGEAWRWRIRFEVGWACRKVRGSRWGSGGCTC